MSSGMRIIMARSTQKTDFLKECMADSLLQLMDGRPVEKVSVDEIVARAGVGRSTYFRNFHSKYEILVFKYQITWKRWMQEHPMKYDPLIFLGHAQSLFSYFYSMKDVTAVLYQTGTAWLLYQAIEAIVMPEEPEDIAKKYVGSYYTHALHGLLDIWIRREYQESIEDLVRILEEEI